MGSMDSAFGCNSEGHFEPDDFYESFLAPKFHDFTAPEVPIDPDAYFLGKPGMAPKNPFIVDEEKKVAPKILKVIAQETPKTAPVNQHPVPPKTPVAAEKAVGSTGSVKKPIARTASSSLTPLASKSLRNGNSICISPAEPPMQDKHGNGSLKPTSLAKKLQASENDDPNSPTNNNNRADVTPSKTAKPIGKSQEDKPALTRQRSQKFLDTKPDVHSAHKAPADRCGVKSYTEKESDTDKGTPRKENPSKPVLASAAEVGVVKALKLDAVSAAGSPAKDHSSAASIRKTPVKEPQGSASIHPDVKKLVACLEVAASPYSGHHCKSARCAANDPNYASPVPTKKYLIAKRGTPGSIRKATPNHARVEKCSDAASSDNSSQSSEETHRDDEGKKLNDTHEVVDGNGCSSVPHTDSSCDNEDRDAAKAHTQVSLEEVFKKMALDQSHTTVNEEQTISQVTVLHTDHHIDDLKDHHTDITQIITQVIVSSEVSEASKSEEFKEVPLMEDRSTVERAQSAIAGDGKDGLGFLVICEDKVSLEITTTKTTHCASDAGGIDLFLKLASEKVDCLDSIDLTCPKLEVLQSKQGKKRKSGELMPQGASKKANTASDSTSKAIPKKVKGSAASKAPKMRMRRMSVARLINPRVTHPRPFRLRTQERGAAKEREFSKKVEEYKAAQEGFNSAFQGLAVAEPKIPGKFLKPGSSHVFSAKRAEFPKTKDDREGEARAQKFLIPPAQKAPLFDHPFKPHRSTKKLTVPQEPKFHAVRRTCPSHIPVPA